MDENILTRNPHSGIENAKDRSACNMDNDEKIPKIWTASPLSFTIKFGDIIY